MTTEIKPYELLLPPLVPALVGKEINIYFDNLIWGTAKRYEFEISTGLGRHENERWTATPTEAGDYPFTLDLYDELGNKLSTAQTLIRVTDATNPQHADVTRNVIFIGDSTTGAGHYTAELLRLFANDPMSLKLLGTRGEGLNVHEGRGGWRVDQYYESEESPFLFDGVLDIEQYIRNNQYNEITDVCIHLGINDVYHAETHGGITQIIEHRFPMIDAMIAQFKAHDSNIRIGIMPCIPPSSRQDSFGTSYGVNQNRRTYVRKMQQWNQALMSRYSNRLDEGIDIIPIYINLDTEHNMPSVTVPANSRSSRPVWKQSNGVHPAPEGYYQMADVIYYWLKQTAAN
ncbi:MAG: hypothetical protein K0R67_1299 [Paenibacillus sp.]|nr:hypothetical protein [Paenibacillus sp.]